jgi:predicted dehydrogenase
MRILSCASQSRRRKEKDESADLVLLATRSFLSVHLQSAVELGKHVFCEKPVVPSRAEVRPMAESARLAKPK